ncbi:hypothetical protein GW915_09265 [bacterium]|nr:hypothetical protein [bacterium]
MRHLLLLSAILTFLAPQTTDAKLFQKWKEKREAKKAEKRHETPEAKPQINEQVFSDSVRNMVTITPAGADPLHRRYFEKFESMYGKENLSQIGLGVSMWKGAPNTGTFVNNAKRAGMMAYADSGKEFLEQMERYTSQNRCIPRMVVATHGPGTNFGGNGFAGYYNGPGLGGFYLSNNYKLDSWHPTVSETGGVMPGGGETAQGAHKNRKRQYLGDGKTFDATSRTTDDLAAKIRGGSIKFCSSCVMALHACTIGPHFAEELAKVTGCQIVFSTSSCSPIDFSGVKNPSNGQSLDNGKMDYLWHTGDRPGSIAVNKARSARGLTPDFGHFLRATPDGLGGARIEKIGRYYVLDKYLPDSADLEIFKAGRSSDRVNQLQKLTEPGNENPVLKQEFGL